MSRHAASFRILAAIACIATLAGCGSGGAAKGAGSSADVRFADCMRTHGVSNFPDPLRTGGFPRGSNGSQSPVSQAALKTCLPILKAGGRSPHAPSGAQLAAALRYARCMRAHGVPGFPDPVTSLSNHNVNVIVDGAILFPLGSSIDPQAPAFQQADATCGVTQRGGQPQGG